MSIWTRWPDIEDLGWSSIGLIALSHKTVEE